VRKKIREQKANWHVLEHLGTAEPLLQSITELSYACQPVKTPGLIYISAQDNLFPNYYAHGVRDLQEGTPNAKIINLYHHAYCHTWPLTAPSEAIRMLVKKEEMPIPPTFRSKVQAHPTESLAVAGAAVVLGLFAYRSYKSRT